MDIVFTKNAWEDLSHWIETDKAIVSKVKELINAIKQNPFQGIGKPEPLRFGLKGYWSRRISGEHRLVYKVDGKKDVNQRCIVIQCRYHY